LRTGKTISEGVAIAGLLLSSAVTIHVAGGTYNEHVIMGVPSSSTLTINGTGSATTTIDDGGTGNDVNVVGTDASEKVFDYLPIDLICSVVAAPIE